LLEAALTFEAISLRLFLADYAAQNERVNDGAIVAVVVGLNDKGDRDLLARAVEQG
jgi:hypothetical protein